MSALPPNTKDMVAKDRAEACPHGPCKLVGGNKRMNRQVQDSVWGVNNNRAREREEGWRSAGGQGGFPEM